MEYYKCKCCGLLIVVSGKHHAYDYECPACDYMGCDDDEFVKISYDEFCKEANINTAMDNNVIFKAKRVDNGECIEGFFTKKQIGNLIVPVIERYKEYDSGDYIESIEVDGSTVKHK